MIIIIVLFFSSLIASGQRYADRPNNPNPNNQPIVSSRTNLQFYNPSQRGPIFINPHETLKERYERITDKRVIFPGPGGNNNNNHHTMQLESSEIHVVAQILLQDTDNPTSFRNFVDERHKNRLFFIYNGDVFQWKENIHHKPGLSFRTLEEAIISAQERGHTHGDFAMLDKNLLALPYPELYITPRPDISKVPPSDVFTLSVITPNSIYEKGFALIVAFRNSRLRDCREGFYAILSHFNRIKAHQLSKEDKIPPFESNDREALRPLVEAVLPYLILENMPAINKILREPGDKDYLSKLQNLQALPNLKPIGHFTYAGALKFIFQLYSAWTTSTLLKNIWVTKKIPRIPTGFLGKTRSFAILLGAGLFIKDLFNGVRQFIIKKKGMK